MLPKYNKNRYVVDRKLWGKREKNMTMNANN